MRACRFAPSAEDALNRQIDYLISVNALSAARALERRVQGFITKTLCHYPFIGAFIPERDVFECWVPGTPLILWYKVMSDEIVIAMIWHASQDRAATD
jgi:plasmid stabilization system protein ParE